MCKSCAGAEGRTQAQSLTKSSSRSNSTGQCLKEFQEYLGMPDFVRRLQTQLPGGSAGAGGCFIPASSSSQEGTRRTKHRGRKGFCPLSAPFCPLCAGFLPVWQEPGFPCPDSLFGGSAEFLPFLPLFPMGIKYSCCRLDEIILFVNQLNKHSMNQGNQS